MAGIDKACNINGEAMGLRHVQWLFVHSIGVEISPVAGVEPPIIDIGIG